MSLHLLGIRHHGPGSARSVLRALDEAQQAVVLDPLSGLVRGRLGLVRMAARQYGAAVEDCRAAVDLGIDRTNLYRKMRQLGIVLSGRDGMLQE